MPPYGQANSPLVSALVGSNELNTPKSTCEFCNEEPMAWAQGECWELEMGLRAKGTAANGLGGPGWVSMWLEPCQERKDPWRSLQKGWRTRTQGS